MDSKLQFLVLCFFLSLVCSGLCSANDIGLESGSTPMFLSFARDMYYEITNYHDRPFFTLLVRVAIQFIAQDARLTPESHIT